MKRSQINKIIDDTLIFTKEKGLEFPKFAYFEKKDWEAISSNSEEIIENMLGWDVTDFGKGDYYKVGLASFTFRNGNFNDPIKYPKPYCEKLLLVEDGQELPFHFHWKKMEDIINRGGGTLEITLYNSDEKGELDRDSEVSYVLDGQKFVVPAGSVVKLFPGNSITLTPLIYHKWKGIEGTGKIMLFEVSSTNDDKTDNRFLEDIPRLILVEDDEEPKHYLFSDYEKFNIKE